MLSATGWLRGRTKSFPVRDRKLQALSSALRVSVDCFLLLFCEFIFRNLGNPEPQWESLSREVGK